MISVHDNFLRGYNVNAEAQTIVLHTIFEEREPFEYTDVVFEGVEAYCFQQDNFGTILFDVTEADPADLYAHHRDL